ncbi:MAG: thioredoxin domain-containing protein, partial [Hoeflea sp.]|uniref:thioredoxin domain-containing protein n=1 Tax=Hoeflea sp. TaxID=1940281 RepID=UPI00329850CD
MFRLTSRLTAVAAVSLLAFVLTACSDTSDEKTETSSGSTETVAPVPTPEPAETATAADEPATPAETATPAQSTAPAETAAPAEATAPAKVAVEAPKPDGDVDMAKVMEQGPLKEMALGEETAPVTIVEYMSMTCPHCASFHEDNYQP